MTDLMAKPEPLYYDFVGLPSRGMVTETWVFYGEAEGWNKGWVRINRHTHASAADELSKADFEYLFPNLPPLPSEAFAGPWSKDGPIPLDYFGNDPEPRPEVIDKSPGSRYAIAAKLRSDKLAARAAVIEAGTT